jgi:SnoaL-like protein
MNSDSRLNIWTAYQAAWGPVTDEARQKILAESVDDDFLYTDPTTQLQGRNALMARIALTQQTYHGAHFRNDSFLAHHDQGLFHWTMYDRDGRALVKGTSFGRFGADGRLVQATGFFEVPASRNAA